MEENHDCGYWIFGERERGARQGAIKFDTVTTGRCTPQSIDNKYKMANGLTICYGSQNKATVPGRLFAGTLDFIGADERT